MKNALGEQRFPDEGIETSKIFLGTTETHLGEQRFPDEGIETCSS